VVNQTYKNWELIIVDDQSDTHYLLPEACRSVDQLIKIIRNQVNIGPGLSRQKGVTFASGSFICFLDSDDYYHPEFIIRSLNRHLECPEAGVTYTSAVYLQSGNTRYGSDSSSKYIMPTLLERKRPWPTCSLLWKREMMAEWRSLRTNQDSLFELECSFKNNRIEFIPEILCYIDKGTGENTSDFVKNRESDLHRNYVAVFAFNNRRRIMVPDSDKKKLESVLVNRIIYVSSKLAYHGFGLHIFRNGLLILPSNITSALKLIILSFPTLIPLKYIRKVCKSLIIYKVDNSFD
jgi:glycosyltransferase involved in cell wall biosynthesis